MESRIAGGGLGFVHFSNFIYVTYYINYYNNGLNTHVAICREINAIYTFVLNGG